MSNFESIIVVATVWVPILIIAAVSKFISSYKKHKFDATYYKNMVQNNARYQVELHWNKTDAELHNFLYEDLTINLSKVNKNVKFIDCRFKNVTIIGANESTVVTLQNCQIDNLKTNLKIIEEN